jgi:hypothetical protein
MIPEPISCILQDMKKTTLASLGLVLLLAYGCGPGNTFAPPSLTPNEVPQVNKATCIPVDTQSTSEADKTVVILNKELVDSVLNEMGNKGFDPATLWNGLSDESREKLNFSINASIKKSRPANYQTIFRATAMFLARILGNYQQGYDYRIKDISGKVISFVNLGVQNPIVIDLSATCNSTSGLDLSYIKLPSSLIMPDEVLNLVVCRFTQNRHFLLMHARSSFMLMSGMNFAKAKKSDGRLSQSSTKLKVKIDAPEFKLDLNMKKKTELNLNGRIANKTSVDLTVPGLDVKEIGACHEQ